MPVLLSYPPPSLVMIWSQITVCCPASTTTSRKMALYATRMLSLPGKRKQEIWIFTPGQWRRLYKKNTHKNTNTSWQKKVSVCLFVWLVGWLVGWLVSHVPSTTQHHLRTNGWFYGLTVLMGQVHIIQSYSALMLQPVHKTTNTSSKIICFARRLIFFSSWLCCKATNLFLFVTVCQIKCSQYGWVHLKFPSPTNCIATMSACPTVVNSVVMPHNDPLQFFCWIDDQVWFYFG